MKYCVNYVIYGKQLEINYFPNKEKAGVCTYNIYSPYPKEFNRQAVGIISKNNFAPTKLAKEHLLAEGRDPTSIFVTGNTVIDAMQYTGVENYSHLERDWVGDLRFIFITAHRRENLGEPMHNMFRAIRCVLDEHPDVKAIYLIHMNAVVRKAADEELGDCEAEYEKMAHACERRIS